MTVSQHEPSRFGSCPQKPAAADISRISIMSDFLEDKNNDLISAHGPIFINHDSEKMKKCKNPDLHKEYPPVVTF